MDLIECNVAVFTTLPILNGAPILYVFHHEEDGAWEFYGEEDVDDDERKVVALEEIVNMDSSLLKVCDLPLGYCARRKAKDAEWEIHSKK